MSDTAPPPPGATFRALLIGAGFYFPNRTSAGEFLSLSAPPRDVAAVEAMLRARVTLPLVLEKLTSTTVPGQSTPAEPEDARPTYANIRSALERLASGARPGDVVFLYYAGHGARILTRFEDLKGPGGFDEALVPIDIQNKSVRYIRDLDIAFILQQLVVKKTVLTVVLDSCHSGGATRGTAIAPRCATGRPHPGAVDTTERPAGGFASDTALRLAYEALRSTAAVQKDGRTGKTWLPSSKGYVFLAASLETQAALEASVEGAPSMGVLTRAWLDAIRDLGTDQSWKTVFERTVRRIEDAGFREQTPVLLGDDHCEIFGTRLLATARTLLVSEVDTASARIRVDGGLALGLGLGSELGIYARGTVDFSADTGLLATATVAEVAPGAAWATTTAEAVSRIQIGALAVIRGLTVRSTVALLPRPEGAPEPAPAAEQEARDALREALALRGEGIVAEASPGETATFRVHLDEQAHYVLTSAEGTPLEEVPRFPPFGEGAAGVAAALVHLARFAVVGRISSPPSILDTQVEIAFLDASGAPLSPGERGRYRLLPGDYQIRITNGSDRDLYVGILDLQSNWEIKTLWPPDDGTRPFAECPAREVRDFSVGFDLPEGVPSGVDRLKVMLLTAEVDYRRLTLPAIGEQRRASPLAGPVRSPLDRLFDALGSPATRALRRSALSDTPWCVRDLVLEIQRAP